MRESGRRRESVLRAMRAAAEPLGAAELAETLRVHPNTVRFHLDALERSGDIDRVPSTATGPGRPQVRYRAVPGRGDRHYELLAAILLAELGEGESGRSRATRAGAVWGRRRARSMGHGGTPADGLLSLLAEAGFAPAGVAAGAIELRNCPFRELVGGGEDPICAVHAGMMRGALAEWGEDVRLEALEPAAAPGPCRVLLAGAEAAA